MNERIQELLPNIAPSPRFGSGTSGGGHHITLGLGRGWPGFVDYSIHFIVHAGGVKPRSHRFPGTKDKHRLVVYGEGSESLTRRTGSTWRVEHSGARADIIGVPGAGHGLNNDAPRVIRRWADALLELPSPAP